MSEARFHPGARKSLDEHDVHNPSQLFASCAQGLPEEFMALYLAGMTTMARAFMLAPEESYAWMHWLMSDAIRRGTPFDEPTGNMVAEIACFLYEHGDTRQKTEVR